MSRPVAAVLLTALATAACVGAPPDRRPEAEVVPPDVWTAASPSGGPVSGLWWESFGDPTLEALILEAMDRNHDLRAAAARIDSAAALAKIAGADLFPTVSASATAGRARRNFIGFPIPGGGSVLSTKTTTLGVSLDTSWEADLWGRIRSEKAAAISDLQAAAADFDAARLSLAGQTAKAWFALAEADQQLELARRNVDSFRSTVDKVRARYERGLRPSLDLRLASTNLQTAEAALSQRESTRASLVRQMEALLGRYPAGELGARPSIPDVPAPPPAGLPAELVARRPDLAALEQRLLATEARQIAARRALYPSIRLTASAGRSSKELHDLLDGDFTVWSLLASITQPIFQGGKLRANVDLADARSREALESFAGATLRAYAEVESALESETFLSRRAASIAAASDEAAAARRLAERRYDTGLDTILTVLEAQRRDLEAEGALLQIRRLRLDARVDLHLALGGGLEDDTGEPSGEPNEDEKS